VSGRTAAALLATLFVVTLGAAPGVTTLGVLRADGVIIPFAAFESGKWRAMWPDPKDDIDVPVNVASVPKSWWGSAGPIEAWQAWTAAGAQPLHVRQPDILPANCLRQIGLRTDYRLPQTPPPIADHPYPKDGLAIAPPQPIEPIDIVRRDAAEWTEFAPILTAAFNKQEQALSDDGDFQHPVDRKTREASPPIIEAIYAYGSAPRIYAVEAARQYWVDPKSPAACKALAFGRIWIRRDRGGSPRVVVASVRVQRCDREDTMFMLPLGVLRLGARVFWIAQSAGWDDERYQVIEITSGDVKLALDRFGGWC
jgi:hypothetical protein